MFPSMTFFGPSRATKETLIVTQKKYKSEAAKKIAEQRKPKPQAQSKKFSGGSNPHHGASLGQSGQPRGKR